MRNQLMGDLGALLSTYTQAKMSGDMRQRQQTLQAIRELGLQARSTAETGVSMERLKQTQQLTALEREKWPLEKRSLTARVEEAERAASFEKAVTEKMGGVEAAAASEAERRTLEIGAKKIGYKLDIRTASAQILENVPSAVARVTAEKARLEPERARVELDKIKEELAISREMRSPRLDLINKQIANLQSQIDERGKEQTSDNLLAVSRALKLLQEIELNQLAKEQGTSLARLELERLQRLPGGLTGPSVLNAYLSALRGQAGTEDDFTRWMIAQGYIEPEQNQALKKVYEELENALRPELERYLPLLTPEAPEPKPEPKPTGEKAQPVEGKKATTPDLDKAIKDIFGEK